MILFRITPITAEGAIVEYSMDGEGNGTYQDSNVFDNLSPMTTDETPSLCSHTFYARVKEDTNHAAGTAINSSLKTFSRLERSDKPVLNYTITKAEDESTYTVTITAVQGAQYCFIETDATESDWSSETNSKTNITAGEEQYIAIRYAADEIYDASDVVSTKISDTSKPQQMEVWLINIDDAIQGDIYKTYGDENFRISVVADYEENSIVYESSNGDVATVERIENDRGIVAFVGAGRTTISVTLPETETYAETTKSFDIIVAKKNLNIEPGNLTMYKGDTWNPGDIEMNDFESDLVNDDKVTDLRFEITAPDCYSLGNNYQIIPFGLVIMDSTETYDHTDYYNVIYKPSTLSIVLDQTALAQLVDYVEMIISRYPVYPNDTLESTINAGVKYITQDAYDAINTAYEQACSAFHTTQAMVNQAVTALQSARVDFELSVKTGTKQSGNSGSSGYVDPGTSVGTDETPKTDTPQDETPATNNVEVSEGAAVYTPEVKVDKDGVASMSISTDEIISILDDMLAADDGNKVDTFEVAAASTKGADAVSLSLAGEALSKLSNDTELSLSVKTDKGDMLIPNELLGELSNVAKKMKLQLDITQAKEEDIPKSLLGNANLEFASATKFEITAGDKAFTKFGDTPITVSMPVPKGTKLPKNPVVITISSDGTTDYIKGTVEGQKVSALAFHFSTFVVTTYDYAEYEKDLGQIAFTDAPVTLYVGGNTGKTATPYKVGDVVVAAKSKTDSKKPVVILSVTADKKGIVSINKTGKLTAKKAGKVNVTYEFVNEKGIKASYKVAVTVKKASAKFVKKAATIKKGTKQTFKIALEGYKKNSVTWTTAKKNRAEVAENKGKLSVKVKGVTKGKDTIYVVVAGKKVAKAKVQVVAGK